MPNTLLRPALFQCVRHATAFPPRLLLPLAILGLELPALMYGFDFNIAEPDESSNFATRFFHEFGAFKAPLATLVLSIFIFLAPRLHRIIPTLSAEAKTVPVSRLALHLAATACFAAASLSVVSSLAGTRTVTVPLFAAWLAMAGFACFSWLAALAPLRTWSSLCRAEFPALSAGIVAGLSIWFLLIPAGEVLWQSLSLVDMTFWAVHGLLDFVYPDVLHNADTRVLGTPDFQVEIFPACSGIEGIFLIAAFLVLYLWVFRKTLRFPNALILLPVGILTIWLVNAFRIALLVAVGTSVSPDIASQGFHSQAGWIGFVLVSFGLILLSHRGGFFLASRAQDHVDADSYNTRAATALLAPMLTLLAASMLAAALSWGFDWLYPAKIAVTAAVLWRFRDAYAGLGWRGSWVGVPIGALVFALWMLLEPAAGPDPTPLQLGLEELPPGLAAAWLAFRAAGSTVVIPLAEELAFRGYLLRKLVRRDFENVAPGAFTWPSFLLSSILFGLLHGRWLAGTLAGMAFALALYRRGRLADAVVAHATANALIAATALLFGYWHLWS